MKRLPEKTARVGAGVTLIELLCVICIIAILASMLLPVLSRAFGKVKGMAEEAEADEMAFLFKQQTRNYCAANSQFRFESKKDFGDKIQLIPKARDWLDASATEFVPFSYVDPTNEVVLQFHIGPRHRTTLAFTKGTLSIQPDR